MTASNPFSPTISNAFVIAVHRIDAATNETLFSLSGEAGNATLLQAITPFGTTVYFDTGGSGGANRLSNSYGVAVGDNVLVGYPDSRLWRPGFP